MTRLPSVKTLSRVFSDPKAARRVLEMKHAELSETEAGYARIRECYSPPAWSDVRMHVLDRLAETYGVEAFQTRESGWVEYLNTGDPYAATLIYRRGRYIVGCWADIAEREHEVTS